MFNDAYVMWYTLAYNSYRIRSYLKSRYISGFFMLYRSKTIDSDCYIFLY